MESTLIEINAAKVYLESIKTRIQNRNDNRSGRDDDGSDSDDDGIAVEFINKVMMEIKIGVMPWFNIEKEFSDLIKGAEPLNQIVNKMKTEPQNDAEDLKNLLKKAEKAIAELNKLKEYLRENTMKELRGINELVEMIKAKVDATPDNLAEELEELEDNVRRAMLESLGIPKKLTNLMQNTYWEVILDIWSAQIAIESLKSSHPSEADQLKQIFGEVETKLFSLKKYTKKQLNQIKWCYHSKSCDDEPPEEVLSVEKCDMFTHVRTVEDLSEPVAKDKREIITRLSELLEAKTPEILERMNQVTQEMKSKYPEDTDLDAFISEKRVKFYEMKDSVKTVADKIKLNAQSGANESVESAGFYTEMFTHILKAKIMNFMNHENKEIRLFEMNLFDLAPVREEGNAKKDFIEAIFDGSLREFSTECFKHFSFLSLVEQEMQGEEYEYLNYM